MTALGPQEVHEFWRNYEDPMIYRVVSFMESVEKWTIDGNPEVEKALQELGDALEGLTKFELGNEEHYVNVLCHLKMARVLRIMQAIDNVC